MQGSSLVLDRLKYSTTPLGCLPVAGVLGHCLKEVMAKLKHKMRSSDLGEEEYKCVRK